MTRLCFVTAPGTSAFMREILLAVADEVGAATDTVRVSTHDGYVDDVVDDETVAVIVPHEYAAVSPMPSPQAMARTIAFGVEHPGTETFHVSSSFAAKLGAWFEIGESSVAAHNKRQPRPRHFPLGYVRSWDEWNRSDAPRPIDVTYLGTADPRRLSILAQAAPALAPFETKLLVPPHEPMVRPRPDFLLGRDKWRHLAQTKVLINLHRDDKTAFEWVRALEAMINGCVIITEPSSDLGPLEPGRHLLVSPSKDIGQVVAAALADPPLLARVAQEAYELCRETLNMKPYALELADVARQLDSSSPAESARTPPAESPSSWAAAGAEPPMAVWVPALPSPPEVPFIESQTPSLGVDVPRGTAGSSGTVAVLCAALPGDGPIAATTSSIDCDGVELIVARVETSVDDSPPHRGRERNALLEKVSAEYVFVLDGGDAVLGPGLTRMAAMMDADPDLDAIVCPATYGGTALVNALAPELRRLEARPYLSRGYLVRAAVLRELGGFTDDPALDQLVDHHFWLTLARAGGKACLMPHVGLALWPRTPAW